MTSPQLHPHNAAKAKRVQTAWTLIVNVAYALSGCEIARMSGASIASVEFMRRHLRSLQASGVTPSGNWAEDRRDCWEVSRPVAERKTARASASASA